LETGRKKKVAAKAEKVEDSIVKSETIGMDLGEDGDKSVLVIPESPVQSDTTNYNIEDEKKTPEKPTVNALDSAPVVYGVNPTAQQVEDFRREYTVWLQKNRK
jgi:hypothetical protein